MSLEAQITKGHAIYIHALGYDIHRAHLIIMFLKDPDETVVARTIIFRGVRNFTDTWHEEEPMQDFDLDSIIGLDAYVEGQQTKYVITTECREIIFETMIQPEIIEHL